jgi:ATP-dependent exoDNAse (exonuclease V) beta subunit
VDFVVAIEGAGIVCLESRRPYGSGNTTCRFKWPIWQHNSSPATGSYWDSFWDADQVFYGHVLGFKGLERRAVVLVVNEASAFERSRERLYVGLSRARDQLVVCGDPDFIREVGGPDLARRLNLAATGFGAL